MAVVAMAFVSRASGLVPVMGYVKHQIHAPMIVDPSTLKQNHVINAMQKRDEEMGSCSI